MTADKYQGKSLFSATFDKIITMLNNDKRSLAKTLEAYDSLRLVEVCEASHESTYVEFIGRKMACKDLWELFSRSLL